MFGFGRKKEVPEYLGRVLVFVGDRLEEYDIETELEGIVNAGGMLLPLENGREHFSSIGDRTLIYNLSIPALTEAEALAGLRESEVIKGLFNEPENKRISEYIPMFGLIIITIMTVLFK